MGHESHNPLDQFKVEKLLDIQIAGFDLSFTNSALYMVLATLFLIGFMSLATRKQDLVPSRLQVIAEGWYSFINNMVKVSVGEKGAKFFPLVFCLFSFILLCNLFGMLPYSFTVTSQIIATLTLAMISFITIVVFAICHHGFKGFLHMFLPAGVPLLMAPVIFIIELFSFIIRPITLSVRLFANMVAGHVLLKVVAGFVVGLGLLLGVVPLLFDVILIGFELFVAVLQAYIFAVLVSAYLGDAAREH